MLRATFPLMGQGLERLQCLIGQPEPNCLAEPPVQMVPFLFLAHSSAQTGTPFCPSPTAAGVSHIATQATLESKICKQLKTKGDTFVPSVKIGPETGHECDASALSLCPCIDPDQFFQLGSEQIFSVTSY